MLLYFSFLGMLGRCLFQGCRISRKIQQIFHGCQGPWFWTREHPNMPLSLWTDVMETKSSDLFHCLLAGLLHRFASCWIVFHVLGDHGLASILYMSMQNNNKKQEDCVVLGGECCKVIYHALCIYQYCLMVQKSGKLVVDIPWFTRFDIHPNGGWPWENHQPNSRKTLMKPQKPASIHRYLEDHPRTSKYHQTFQVPKTEVLSYISCM